MESKNYQFVETSYGKSAVKILHVVRSKSAQHDIVEYEVNTLLTLENKKDYTEGDNSFVIPTDTQKNTVYAVAQKYGVGCPEEFGIILSQHFISQYKHVTVAKITVTTVNGWERVSQAGRLHNHAFISVPQATRYTEVTLKRNGNPEIVSGLKDMRVLKTTQSAFVNFYQCEFTTLQPANDRILSTVVQAEWTFDRAFGVNFDKVWRSVKALILDHFAGPADEGTFSPSVQLTMYNIECDVLNKLARVKRISMALPNVHYFEVDMTRFIGAGLKNTKSIYQPTDKPSGLIKATLERKPASKL